MIVQERQQEILSILNRKGYQTVAELAHALFISEPTVRRELKALEADGMLCRLRGGAAPLNASQICPSLSYLIKVEKERKQQLARCAAQLVKNHSSVFLSGADITLFMLPYLAKIKNVTVFTYALNHAQASANLGLKTICLGGQVNSSGDVCQGLLTLQMIELVHVDMLFFAPPSILPTGEVLHYSQKSVAALRSLFKRSEKKVLLCRDSDIWQNAANFLICKTDETDYILGNDPFPEKLPAPRERMIVCAENAPDSDQKK